MGIAKPGQGRFSPLFSADFEGFLAMKAFERSAAPGSTTPLPPAEKPDPGGAYGTSDELSCASALGQGHQENARARNPAMIAGSFCAISAGPAAAKSAY
jgi:hypothetical protein